MATGETAARQIRLYLLFKTGALSVRRADQLECTTRSIYRDLEALRRARPGSADPRAEGTALAVTARGSLRDVADGETP